MYEENSYKFLLRKPHEYLDFDRKTKNTNIDIAFENSRRAFNPNKYLRNMRKPK